jgi:hypothetical protein
MSVRVVAIDWSGARAGAGRRIWLAECAAGRLWRLENGRDREAVAEHLLEEGRRTPETVVGLDFAFSLPAWFLEERGLASARDLWALAGREAERWLAACAPPFWGRPGRRRPNLPAHLRWTDGAQPAVAGRRPKSVFQVGGAGAVGTGSLRGMRLLHRLRAAGWSIWPFDPPGWPRAVEIYPRLLTGPVVKSDPVARQAYLARRYPTLAPHLRTLAASSEDAFDAAVSALVMAAHLGDLVALAPATDREALLEGLIWLPAGPVEQVD